MSEERISREEVEQVKRWAIAAASGHPVLIEEPAEKVALICCQLLAADDALKLIANSYSNKWAYSYRVARAAMLPRKEVKDA